jgi:hypothetical protein
MYASFKEGKGEEVKKGRFFNSYNDDDLHSLIEHHASLSLVKYWKTEDARKGKGKVRCQTYTFDKTVLNW